MSFQRSDNRKWLFTNNVNDLRGNLAAKVLLQATTDRARPFMLSDNFDDAIDLHRNAVHYEISQFVADVGSHIRGEDYHALERRWDSFSAEDKAWYERYVEYDPVSRKIVYKKIGNNYVVGLDFPLITGFEGVYMPNGDYTVRFVPEFLRELLELHEGEPSTAIRFNLNVDELVRKRMFAISKAQVSDELPERDQGYKLISFDCTKCGVITRGADGSLYRTNEQGEKLRIDLNDDETKRMLKSSNKCYGTYLDLEGENCKDFIHECLISNDPNALEKCLRDRVGKASFWNIAREDIKELHPIVALRILQRFGFHKYQTEDSNGVSVWKVESVEHWLKNYMAKQFTSDTVQDMLRQNDTYHILDYLQMVSNYVNCNPGILNKNYVSTAQDARSMLEMSDMAKRLGLQWELPRPKAQDFKRLGNYWKSQPVATSPFTVVHRGNVVTPWGRTLTPGVSMLGLRTGTFGSGLFGGGNKCDNFIKRSNNLFGHELAANVIKFLITELQRRGKSLNRETLDRIGNKLKQYEEIENEIWRMFCYIDEYGVLLDALEDYKAETINSAYMEKLVKNSQILADKRVSSDASLLKLITRLQHELGEGPEDMKSVNPSDIY